MATTATDFGTENIKMIIDCHGHYTTAPAQLQSYREAQIAQFEDPSRPAPQLAAVTDDEIRESIEQNQLRALKERGADMTIFSPKASAMARHIGDEAVSKTWTNGPAYTSPLILSRVSLSACAIWPPMAWPVSSKTC